MKKVLLLAACALLSSGAFAQFSWGIKGGLNISSLTQYTYGKMKTGIYVGAFAEYRFNDIFSIQPEIVYSRQGVSSVAKEDAVTARTGYRANYINIPVLAKIYVLDRLSVEVGPQVGFALTAKQFAKVVDTSHDRDVIKEKDRLKNNMYRTVDFSIPMGLSYKLNPNISVSARYNLGITKFFKDGYTDGNHPCRNSVIQLGFGFQF